MSGVSNNNYDKTYYNALGRERYIQMSKINLIININKKIIVTFDRNEGNCSIPRKTVTYNSTYGTLPIATKPGYGFAGWYTSKFGGNKITSSSKVTEMENHTLYARWTCTVRFDPNGGICDKTSEQVIVGNKYGVLPVPVRTGYTFAGWYTLPIGGSNVTAGTTVPFDGNHVLYAQWIPALYMVTYDANGGTCTIQDKQVTYDSAYGTLPMPTREGHIFKGWHTEKTGGTLIVETTKVSKAENHTLYAHWDINTYMITYDANGGSGAPDNQIKTHNVDLDLSTTVPTRDGYEFLGWATSVVATSGTYQPGDTYTENKGVTLYAIWNKTEYTVTFNTNATGVSISIANKKVTIGEKYGALPTPTRTGYTFAGWYTQASGGSKVISTTIVETNQDHVLYAHWHINTYTINYDANGGSGAPSRQTKYYGKDLILSSKAPTRDGYEFLGWATSVIAGTGTYQPGGTYTANRGATLYAIWKQVIDVTGVTLNQTSDQWIPNNNSTVKLTATVSPSNATNKTVTWKSSNTAVATVNNGTVTAKGAGFATITATAGGKSASIKIYVYNAENNGYQHYTYTSTSTSSTRKGNIVKGDKVVLQTVQNSWHKILYSTNTNITGGYIWISPNGTTKNYYLTYNFDWTY